jgi:hypothetical protein
MTARDTIAAALYAVTALQGKRAGVALHPWSELPDSDRSPWLTRADVVIAAVRAMPPEEIAELTRGYVEHADNPVTGHTCIRAYTPWIES